MKNQQTYLIENNWWLLRIFASKTPLKTTLFVAPLALYFLISIKESLSFSQVMACFVVGILWWSFLEYMIHRFFFHWASYLKKLTYYIGSFHLYHHRIPKDQRVYTSGIAPAVFWSVISINFFPIFFTQGETYLISLVTLLSYFTYEFAHYHAHVTEAKSGYLKFIQQNHLHHHLNPKVNFGQTSPLWDIIFGTYASSDEKKIKLKKEFLYVEGTWK